MFSKHHTWQVNRGASTQELYTIQQDDKGSIAGANVYLPGKPRYGVSTADYLIKVLFASHPVCLCCPSLAAHMIECNPQYIEYLCAGPRSRKGFPGGHQIWAASGRSEHPFTADLVFANLHAQHSSVDHGQLVPNC